jgi:hypothetical protein
MKTLARAALLVGFAATLGGCSTPSDRRYASMVLTGLPFTLGLVLLVQALLYGAWRRISADVRWDPRPAGAALALAMASAIAVGVDAAALGEEPLRDLGVVLLLFGTSFATFALFSLRLWLAFAPATAFTWSFAPVLVAMTAPAIPMLLRMTRRWMDDFLFLIWVFPGAAGIVPLVVLVLLAIEAEARMR